MIRFFAALLCLLLAPPALAQELIPATSGDFRLMRDHRIEEDDKVLQAQRSYLYGEGCERLRAEHRIDEDWRYEILRQDLGLGYASEQGETAIEALSVWDETACGPRQAFRGLAADYVMDTVVEREPALLYRLEDGEGRSGWLWMSIDGIPLRLELNQGNRREVMQVTMLLRTNNKPSLFNFPTRDHGLAIEASIYNYIFR